MSKIKQSLPEDVDITDPRDDSGSLGSNEPNAVDWAIAQLPAILSTLEEGYCSDYADELQGYAKRLQEIANFAKVPF